MSGPVGEGDFEAFGEEMDGIAGAEAEGCGVEALEDVEDLGDVYAAGTGGRGQGQFVSAVGGDNGFAANSAIRPQVLRGEDAAVLLDVVGNRLSQDAAVEDVWSFLCDCAEGGREVRLEDEVAGFRGVSVGEKCARCCREPRHVLLLVYDRVLQVLTDPKAVFRMPNGGLHDGFQVQSAPVFDGFGPAFQGAGNADRKVADFVLPALGLHVIGPGVGDGPVYVGGSSSGRMA